MKKIPILLIFIIAFQITSPSFLWCQNSKSFAQSSLAEKIYLQLDNEVYTTNKTIWFKAIIANAALNNPTFSSGILYVDLINSNKEIIDSKILKIENGIGNGFFELNRNYVEGIYLIRAYTEWNKNFNSDFVFSKYVGLYNEIPNQDSLKVIQNIRVIDTSENELQLKADIYPQVKDKNYNDRKLKIIKIQDGIIDTLILKKKIDEKYVFDNSVPKNIKQVQLKLLVNNKEFNILNFSPESNYLDVQFFPESGKLIHGLSNRIGFKGIGVDGKGQYIEGAILNNTNNKVAEFRSNSLGMGSFVLRNLDSLSSYRAVIKSKSNLNDLVIPLPKVFTQGVIMNVSKENNNINVFVNSSDKTNQNISLKATCRGYVYFNEEVNLDNGSFKYIIPNSSIPTGIIVLTLFDENNIPMAERLVFNEQEESKVVITANLPKKEYQQREKVKLDIILSSLKGVSNSSNLSVLVINKQQFNGLQQIRENILSYFLVSSDLKGSIDNPGAYFTDKNQLNIDDLLLTQGWSSYKYKKIYDNFKYELEPGLRVSGVVNTNDSKIEKSNLELMLMTFGEKRALYTKKINVPGSFNFELDDMYGSDKDIIIQLVDPPNDKKKYTIALNKRSETPVYYNDLANSIAVDSIVSKVITENRYQKNRAEEFNFSNFGRTILDEVIIDGYKMTPLREKNFNIYGKPNLVISGNEIIEKEKDWSYGLYSVLRSGFGDKINISRLRNRDLVAKSYNGNPTLIVVDDIPVVQQFIPLIQNISIDQVLSFELIDEARNFTNLYPQVYPESTPPYPIDGSVIVIYTKKGKGLFGALGNAKNQVTLKSIPVFSIEKEFYSPKYSIDDSYEIPNLDLRAPLYWNPEMKTNKDGKVELEFYNSDITGEFLIIIESISNSGQLGYKCIDYSVKEAKN